MTITYVVETLYTRGGTERILSEKANYLSDRYGYNVHIISCTQKQDQPNAFPLSPSVKQTCLGIPLYSQYRYRYPKRLFVKLSLNKILRKSVTDLIQKINPDILIGIGHFKADMISTIDCHAKKITECHESRVFTLLENRVNKTLLSSIYLYFFRNKYFQIIEKNTDVVITLTNDDKKEWQKAKCTEVIPNFSTMSVSDYCNNKHKRIIPVGRLEWEKGYERLIDIWEKSSIQHPDWSLDIFGDGTQRNNLQEIINNRKIRRIQIHHATNDISKEYANSSICVLTSYYEGFALVLLEALKHGVPCIGF